MTLNIWTSCLQSAGIIVSNHHTQFMCTGDPTRGFGHDRQAPTEHCSQLGFLKPPLFSKRKGPLPNPFTWTLVTGFCCAWHAWKRMKASCSQRNLCVCCLRGILVDKIAFILRLLYVYPLSSLYLSLGCFREISQFSSFALLPLQLTLVSNVPI